MGNLSDRHVIIRSRSVCRFVNVLLGTDNGLWDRASADGWTAANQTNLAIKGIIAIQAMSEMCIIVDQVAQARIFSVRTNLSLL